MKNLDKIHLITEHWLIAIIKNKGLWIPTICCMIISLISYWDNSTEKLVVLSFSMNRGGRSTALQTLFFDWHFCWCILISLLFFFPKVITPIKNSYTISNTLWLRFTNTNNMNLVFSRVYILIFSITLVSMISILWAIAFCFKQQIDINTLFYPIMGMISYMIFSGGLAILLCSIKVRNVNFGLVVSLLSLSLPFFLSSFEDELRISLNGFFPNPLPTSLNSLNPYTLKEYLSAVLFGILFIMFHILINFFHYLKFKTNERV